MKSASEFLFHPVLRCALATLAGLALAAPVQAQSTVTTVTRKPSAAPNTGFVNGATPGAQFADPAGLSIAPGGTTMYVADYTNNAIRQISLPIASGVTLTFTNNGWPTNKIINHPIDVAVDGATNIYVLNAATGTNNSVGSIVKFNQFANFLGYVCTNIVAPTAFAFDGSTNLYVTFRTNYLLELSPNAGLIVTNGFLTNPPAPPVAFAPAQVTEIWQITNAGTKLDGIAVLDNGLIALADGNTNSGIRLLNPASGAVSILTGFNGVGDTIGTATFTQFKNIAKISKAGGGVLVVADWGNGRVKLVDASGTATVLFGIATNLWAGVLPGIVDGPGIGYPAPGQGAAAARQPFALLVDLQGNVYDTENYYNIIRVATGTGLTGPGGVNSGSGSTGGTSSTTVTTNSSGTVTTNTTSTIPTPLLSPATGYFPMGQSISVQSPYADVFYTTDGSLPTTNSQRVVMNANNGTILWNNSVDDLTALNVAAFNVTNSSLLATGIASLTNNVGVPTGRYPQILAGQGATILLPVVVNLDTNDSVKSFQLRLEIAPNVTTNIFTTNFIAGVLTNVTVSVTNLVVPPALPYDIGALSISTNDFVPVTTTAQNGQTAEYSVQPYTLENTIYLTNVFVVSNTAIAVITTNVVVTNGLVISAIGTNSNVSFTRFAVAAMLSVTLPGNGNVGDTYNVQVLDPSATSDGRQAGVTLHATPSSTILVTNLAYTVGDVAPAGWYNAGDFGDTNLANNDVNTIFYASVGVRVPDAFSDVFDAMDTFPVDDNGFVGGDGQIRFLDWQVAFDRSLRLDGNNYVRAWSPGGMRISNTSQLITPAAESDSAGAPAPGQVWYKEAKIGAAWGTNGLSGSVVTVPVYLRVITGANVSGMEFLAIVSPNDDVTPALAQNVQFIPAAGVTIPSVIYSTSNQDVRVGCGWPLGSFNASALSSNIVGWLQITIPANATSGESYTVHFANADGSPAAYSVNNAEYTEYNFESCSATINVGYTPAPATDGISDEWKINFFGSVNSPSAAANADPDGDGSPNWLEYQNGTDPTAGGSYLHLVPGAVQTSNSQRFIPFQWLSAPGKIYAVERTTSLGSPGWSTVQTLSGDGYQHSYNETNLANTAVFYRVRVTAP